MFRGTIGSVSVVILISSCLTAGDPFSPNDCGKLDLKPVENDRQWVARIYTVQNDASRLECFGAFIHWRAVLIHSDCGDGLQKENILVVTKEGKRDVVERIIHRPERQSKHAVLILSETEAPDRNRAVISLPKEGKRFESCQCILMSYSSNLENIETRLVNESLCRKDPGLICIKSYNVTLCPGRDLLICPKKSNVSEFVLAGLLNTMTESSGGGIDDNCKSTFAATSYARSWVDSLDLQGVEAVATTTAISTQTESHPTTERIISATSTERKNSPVTIPRGNRGIREVAGTTSTVSKVATGTYLAIGVGIMTLGVLDFAVTLGVGGFAGLISLVAVGYLPLLGTLGAKLVVKGLSKVTGNTESTGGSREAGRIRSTWDRYRAKTNTEKKKDKDDESSSESEEYDEYDSEESYNNTSSECCACEGNQTEDNETNDEAKRRSDNDSENEISLKDLLDQLPNPDDLKKPPKKVKRNMKQAGKKFMKSGSEKFFSAIRSLKMPSG